MTDFLSAFGSYDFAVRQVVVLSIVGLSMYLLLRAGIFGIPQVGFMAIGGYTSALLMLKEGLPYPVALIAAGAAAALSGLLLGALLARLDGVYLAIATIAFSVIVQVLATNLGFAGGAAGLFGIPTTANDLYIIGVLLLLLLLFFRLERTRFGLAMVAMRDQPLMTAHQGVSVRGYRVGLFAASGFVAGIGGSFLVHITGFIIPSTYSFELLIQLVAAVVIGGMANVLGPLLGSILIFGLPLELGFSAQYQNVVDGVLIVLMVAAIPSGLTGVAGRLGRATRSMYQRRRDAFLVRRGPLSGADAGVPPPPGDAVVRVLREAGDPVPVPRTAEQPLLTLSGITKSFGGVRALRGVTLEVMAREVFGVIGPNGSGKTTLLNILSGVFAPDGGTAVFAGKDISAHWGRPHELARIGMSRTFQGIRLVGELSVLQNVMLGAYHRQTAGLGAVILAPGARRRDKELRRAAETILDEVGLLADAARPAASLPYGLQRRVEIARAVLSSPALLMLDEPTAGMTPVERGDVFDLIEDLRVAGRALIVVEHDVEMMTNRCDRLAVLNFGELIACGPPAAVMEMQGVVDAYIGQSS